MSDEYRRAMKEETAMLAEMYGAENERLREALEKIARGYSDPMLIASAALEAKP